MLLIYPLHLAFPVFGCNFEPNRSQVFYPTKLFAVLTTIFLAAASKTIAFVGVAIVMVFVVYGYYLDIKKKNERRH